MSERILPKPSNQYFARRVIPMAARIEKSGAVMLYIEYALVGAEMNYTDVHAVCLVAKDGTPQQNSMKNLASIWPDAMAENDFIGALQDLPVNDDGKAEFKLSDCYIDDEYIKEGETEPTPQFRARWLNPLEGGGRMPAPMTDDERKQILAKFGSKFNALKPKPATASSTESASRMPSRKGPASREPDPEPEAGAGEEAFTCTGDKVFEALTKKYPKENKSNPDGLAEKAFVAAEKTSPKYKKSGDVSDVTEEQWGAVAIELGLKDLIESD